MKQHRFPKILTILVETLLKTRQYIKLVCKTNPSSRNGYFGTANVCLNDDLVRFIDMAIAKGWVEAVVLLKIKTKSYDN
ncbi:hypothetical protein DIU31_002555 [Mucilaginibacter rubeus]|uniref:Uncharacterized protein n=1 Tax=Mucilaginibacter rubeus TaxID=2027860 RepID=A0AAE6JB50_9SPHI|nr:MULTISPECIES: hypothetical protein [Mucilaginibacter]QEM02454.1 hypothetical protein DIU31_002555 [Mucilaginibacter rubeus]QEM15078.1 hypothetical protein DIU38_002585 [Mucilaginibacter gossypii]QTE42201.1 hypothetical protein J3L19_25210 [Mucilaginibacter rubeus]QTE48803.1 hypothetical protein J3L21_25185 [Mucilaginibacter rubeus]QTE53901.1 hypothetical protein J3L23_16815 [Mucilaginibacter rubeus]